MPDYTSQDFATSGVDIDTYIDKAYGYNLPMKSPRELHQEEEYAVGYQFDQYEHELKKSDDEDEENEDEENEDEDKDLGHSIKNKTGWDDEEDVDF